MMCKPDSIDDWLSMLEQPQADRDYKPGHQRMQRLLAQLDLRRPRYRIRIAGTNGKGSTAHMLAHALQATGLSVGLFTSPHIQHFHERIRMQGESINDTVLHVLLAKIVPLALETGASYFETATALALQAFSDAQVDVEILEAGVGARLDSTTAVDADMALLTPIGLDHQQWLGNSIEEITQEKVCVADGCKYFFSAPQSAEVSAILRALISPPVFAEPVSLPLALLGQHQQVNAALAMQGAIAACDVLLPHVDKKILCRAIAQTQVAGRMQCIHAGKATLWLDAAHNQHAVEALLASLPSLAKPLDVIMVFTREDRSLLDALPLLQPFSKQVIAAEPDSGTTLASSVQQALQKVLTENPQAKVLLLGSFMTVAAALSYLNNTDTLNITN